MDLVRAVGVVLLLSSSAGTLSVPAITGAEDRPSTAKENRARAQALVKKGDELIEAKRPAEALAAYTQAVDADGSYDVAYTHRALAYYALGPTSFDAARADAAQAIRLNPSSGNAYYLRAMVNRRAGQPYQEDLETAARLGNARAKEILAGGVE
ncbi:MAG: hypothetical protein WCK73_13845, partial [Deltaproteobacteria bacterium]